MMRHYIIGTIVGLGLTVGALALAAPQTSDVTPYVTTSGHTGRWTIEVPPQCVTINPQATFIVLHRTLDPMAVLCIETPPIEPSGLRFWNDTMPMQSLSPEEIKRDGLPNRICKTIQDWTR